jgi:hypothetical protein
MFEAAADTMSGNEEIGYMVDFFRTMFMDTFAMNPLPQVVKPILEQWANKSFFTGRPIESQRLKALAPGARKDPWTSETAQLAGKLGISPKRAEALIRGYFSTVGMFVLGMTDIAVHYMGDFPSDPEKRLGDYFVVGNFIKDAETPGNTKYTTRFYEALREMDEVVRTINDYKKSGNLKKAREYRKEKLSVIKHKKELNRLRKKASSLNSEIRKVYERNIPSKEKTRRLDKLKEKRNNITKKGYELIMRDRSVPPSGRSQLTLREAISRK